MTSTLVDTNVLIDILGPETPDREWSLRHLKASYLKGDIVLSPVVWAELSAAPLSEVELVHVFSWLNMKKEPFGFDEASMAGKAHRQYRLSGGLRERTLPDFMIGAHAAVANHRLLTRDGARYRTYFPSIDLISPDTHP